jgi:heme-degrading monooxygenase HmoA
MKTTYLKDQGVSVMNFARNIRFELKKGKEQEFNTLFEKEVLPILRKQGGFQQEVTLTSPTSAAGISLSLWDNRKSAETYQTETYPKVLAKLTDVIEGTPKVETYETASSYLRA